MIEVVHLFPKLNDSLIELLRSLTPAQWEASTVCAKWRVKDIAAHLLDTAMRRISADRDSYPGSTREIRSYDELVTFLNEMNAVWVNAYRRVSPALIVEQMIPAQNSFLECISQLDPRAPAAFPVSWAGEEQSQNWFDIAREYTERWHHQQQIRLATGNGTILTRELYHPFLEICMQALPFHYSKKDAAEGTAVKINVVGDAGGSWTIRKSPEGWIFAGSEELSSEVFIDQNIAWLLWSKGIDVTEAAQYWQVTGNYDLGFHAVTMKAFMV